MDQIMRLFFKSCAESDLHESHEKGSLSKRGLISPEDEKDLLRGKSN